MVVVLNVPSTDGKEEEEVEFTIPSHLVHCLVDALVEGAVLDLGTEAGVRNLERLLDHGFHRHYLLKSATEVKTS